MLAWSIVAAVAREVEVVVVASRSCFVAVCLRHRRHCATALMSVDPSTATTFPWLAKIAATAIGTTGVGVARAGMCSDIASLGRGVVDSRLGATADAVVATSLAGLLSVGGYCSTAAFVWLWVR